MATGDFLFVCDHEPEDNSNSASRTASIDGCDDEDDDSEEADTPLYIEGTP